MVARSGFVVYEGGNSIFDESVLVFLARPRGALPGFDIFDHVGRPLGQASSSQRNPLFELDAETVYYDTDMNELLRVTATIGGFKSVF